eukprot:m.12774 g.12774  ORF g.12774 m.12774 type:complete len:58 (+) comp10027_c1_seq1:66-239(+)
MHHLSTHLNLSHAANDTRIACCHRASPRRAFRRCPPCSLRFNPWFDIQTSACYVKLE